jgi:hypothetical protein
MTCALPVPPKLLEFLLVALAPPTKPVVIRRHPRTSPHIRCTLGASAESEGGISGRFEALPGIRFAPLQGLRGDGARRIRTADLLGAIQGDGERSARRIPHSRAVQRLVPIGDRRRIYVDIRRDMRRFGHTSPLVPNPAGRRFKVRIRASARLRRSLSDACRRQDLCRPRRRDRLRRPGPPARGSPACDRRSVLVH